uniref:Uncharacterized protein n=1 Tax=Rhizophora mucronata TaxID=61149 RepID=A0A2P2KYF3_RHIMU
MIIPVSAYPCCLLRCNCHILVIFFFDQSKNNNNKGKKYL